MLEYDRACVSDELAKLVKYHLDESIGRILSGRYMSAGAVVAPERRDKIGRAHV